MTMSSRFKSDMLIYFSMCMYANKLVTLYAYVYKNSCIDASYFENKTISNEFDYRLYIVCIVVLLYYG